MASHRRHYKNWKAGKGRYVSSFKLIEIEGAYIELIEDCPCESKEQLNRREGVVIRSSANCINKSIAGRTMVEYRADNKEAILEQKRQYRADNKETISEYKRQYRADNKEAIKEQRRQYYADNKEQEKERQRARRAAAKESNDHIANDSGFSRSEVE
jgi:hypothetical protein